MKSEKWRKCWFVWDYENGGVRTTARGDNKREARREKNIYIKCPTWIVECKCMKKENKNCRNGRRRGTDERTRWLCATIDCKNLNKYTLCMSTSIFSERMNSYIHFPFYFLAVQSSFENISVVVGCLFVCLLVLLHFFCPTNVILNSMYTYLAHLSNLCPFSHLPNTNVFQTR